LQEFFLKNFKIIAIIESKVERWFEDADINTCITILEKCDQKEERNNNLVRFVQLKEPLIKFVPIDSEKERWEKIEEFIEFVNKTKNYYEDDKLRIFPKKQAELWEEGFDGDVGEYVGSKWGKYIRAPEIFYRILEKGKGKIVPLNKMARVVGGIITGNNKFFYLTNEKAKKWGIEDKFLIPVVKTPRELSTISFSKEDLKYKLIYVDKDKKSIVGTNALKYIEEAEKRGIYTAPTFKGRRYWYEIPDLKVADLLWPDLRYERHICHINQDKVPFEHNYYGFIPKNPENSVALCAYFNSTIAWLFVEIFGRTGLGQGAIRLVGMDLRTFPVIHVNSKKVSQAFKRLSERPVGSVFEEIGATSPTDVSLEKVKSDRRELDKVVMSDILGLTDEEQLEVYRAVIDLVKSRIQRAKSVAKREREIKGVDVDALVESVLKDVGGGLKRFPDDYIGACKCKELMVPEGKVEVGSDIYGFYIRVGGQEIRCESPYEAKYIQYATINGHTKIRIPLDKSLVEKAVKEYEPLLRETKKRISDFLEATVPDRKLREKVKDVVWERLWRGPLKV
jgi:hypothetical protein